MPLLTTTLMAAALADVVRWEAPPGCPAAEQVRGRVADLLGRVPTEGDLQAEGVVKSGPPWRLELSTLIAGRRQHRALSGDDCQAVTEAAALILAVSVDPVGVTQHPEVSGSPVSETDRRNEGDARVQVPTPAEREDDRAVAIEGPEAPEPEADPSTPSERRAARLRPWLRVGLGGELGAVPGGTGGARLGLSLRGERAQLRIEGGYWIDRLAELREQPQPIGASVGLGTVSIAGGVRLGGERVTVPLVIGLEAGGLRTQGVGLDQARSLTFPWLAGLVGLGAELSLTPRVGLFGQVEAFAPLTRPSVQVGQGGDTRELHRVEPVGGRVLVGLAVMVGRS